MSLGIFNDVCGDLVCFRIAVTLHLSFSFFFFVPLLGRLLLAVLVAPLDAWCRNGQPEAFAVRGTAPIGALFLPCEPIDPSTILPLDFSGEARVLTHHLNGGRQPD